MNESLVAYVRQALAAGVPRAEIERTLAITGWKEADVAAAFTSLAVPAPAPPVAVPTPMPESVPSEPVDPNASFLAEMERRRRATETAAPAYNMSDSSRAGSAPIVVTETGLIGFLLRSRIVSTAAQANQLLIGVCVVIVGVIVWLNWP